ASPTARVISAAAPKPTMPVTSSVPDLKPRSCPPPKTSGTSLTRGFTARTKRAPTPFGPHSLCAEKDTRSRPKACTSSGILPSAWAASVWNRTPRSLQTRAISPTGLSVPISLFAAITETRTVRSVSASAPAGVEDGAVLEGGRDDVGVGRAPRPRGAENREVVRLGRSGREDDLPWVRADERREGFARFRHRGLGAPAENVARRG